MVNTDSGKSSKSVHLQPEWLFTLNQNRCSRSSGMGVHDGPEYAFQHNNEMYRSNLQMMAKKGYVPTKGIGLAASAVVAFERELEKIQRADGSFKENASLFVGEVGEQIEREVKLETVIPCDSRFGVSLLHIFRDLETDAKVTWFNSGASKFNTGQTYKIKGRVKSQEVREGLKQTLLSRVSCADLKLHEAFHGDMDEKDYLKKLKKIEDIDAQDARQETLLYKISVIHGHYGVGSDIMRELLDRGADPTIRSKQSGDSPFDLWVLSENKHIVDEAIETHPEATIRWTDEELEKYDLLDAEFVPKLRATRDAQIEKLANQSAIKRQEAIDKLFGEPTFKKESDVGALVELECPEEEDETDLLKLA